jgi:hypothetical protein
MQNFGSFLFLVVVLVVAFFGLGGLATGHFGPMPQWIEIMAIVTFTIYSTVGLIGLAGLVIAVRFYTTEDTITIEIDGDAIREWWLEENTWGDEDPWA